MLGCVCLACGGVAGFGCLAGKATTRVRPYGDGNHKSCPYGVVMSGSCCGACLGIATGPCGSVRF